MKNPQVEENWEAEFNKKFGIPLRSTEKVQMTGTDTMLLSEKEIKGFIRSALASQLKEIREKVEELLIENVKKEVLQRACDGRQNLTLKEVLQILSNTK